MVSNYHVYIYDYYYYYYLLNSQPLAGFSKNAGFLTELAFVAHYSVKKFVVLLLFLWRIPDD